MEAISYSTARVPIGASRLLMTWFPVEHVRYGKEIRRIDDGFGSYSDRYFNTMLALLRHWRLLPLIYQIFLATKPSSKPDQLDRAFRVQTTFSYFKKRPLLNRFEWFCL